MKRIILILTIISHFVFGQNISTKYDATTKKSYLQTGVAPKANIVEYTDTVSGKSPIWQFDTPRIKYKNQRIETDTSKFDKVNVGKGDSAFWVSKFLVCEKTKAGNGLTKIGDTLKLGGTLNDSTVINLNNRSFVLRALNTGSNKNVFKIIYNDYLERTLLSINNTGHDAIAIGDGNTGLNSVRARATYLGAESGMNNAVNGGGSGAQPTSTYGFRAGKGTINAHSSIFIGNESGLNDSVDTRVSGSVIQIGRNTNSGKFINTIAIGDSAKNTKTNQLALGGKYRHVLFRGIPYELPSSQGASNTYLKNDGSGVLTWATAGGVAPSTPNLEEVMVEGNSAGFNQIKDLSAGLDPDDAVNLQQLNDVYDYASDTLKVGRIAQGRGTTAGSMYFNGVAWVKNDTSYIPRSGADNITGNLKSNQSYFEIGLNGGNNSLQFSDQSYTQIFSGSAGTGVVGKAKATSTSFGAVEVGVDNLSNAGYSRLLTIGGSNTTTPDLTFKFDKGIGYYNGDYSAQMESSQNLIPSLKKVKQLISDSISGGGGGTLTSVYSANSDILVDSSITGKRKLTLNKTLTSGYINIGDGTNTAFPRALSGDATVSNTGVVSVSNATNAGTATALQTARTIGIATGDVTSSGSSFNGTANNTNALTVTKINGTSLAGLGTGILKNTTGTGVPSIAVSGTDYEVPLTFSTGLTRATNTITNNLSTGVSGGQTLIGSTSTTSGITYKTTTGVGTTGADHVFVVGNNGATRAMTITNAALVGIGVTSPLSQLHLSSDVTNSTKGLMIEQHSTDNASSSLFFRKSRGTLLSPTTVANQDYISITKFFAYDGTSYLQTAGVGAIVNGTVATGSVPTDLFFYTSALNVGDPYSLSNLRMAITSTGNVGIGITSPTTGRLQISAGSATVAGFQLTNQTAYTGGVAGSISLENTNEVTVVGNIVSKRGTTANIGTSDNQALQLVTNNTSRLSIGTSGIVTLTAPLVGIASQDVFNTTSTTVNAFGAATSGTLFGTSTASVTYGIGNNATASGNTKAINIGTSGASGSTTNVVIGSSNSGANSTLTVNGTIKSTGYTVATLPTGSVGMRAYVTDALAPSYSATVVGGGAVIVSVFHNGTTWICN